MSIITVRIPKMLKDKLEKYNVNVSETVRKMLEKYVEELELRNLEEKLELLKEHVGCRIDPKLVASLVREDREKR